MNGTNLKKITAAFFVVLLVFIVLQAGEMVSPHKQFSYPLISNTSFRIVSTPNSVDINDLLLQAPIEICPQSYPQRSDFKKTFSLMHHTLFQTTAYPLTDFDFILEKGVLPSTPFYISYCNLLI